MTQEPQPTKERVLRQDSSLWKHRDFMLLWGGQGVSVMGSAITELALPLTAVIVLKASAFQVGLLTSATTAAFALIALPAGAIVERRAKRTIMVWCDVSRALTVGSVPVAASLGLLTMAQLYIVALITGIFTVFFDVSYQSYLPVLLEREHLMDGNGKLGATNSFAQVCGPGLGGVFVTAVGAASTITVDAASYIVSVVSLIAIRTPEKPDQRAPSGKGARGIRAEIAEGLSFVFRNTILRKIAACTATLNLFSAMASALEILFMVRVLHIRPTFVGLLLALGALGGVAGGVLSGHLTRWIGSARIIWFSLLVLGLPELLAPLARQGWGVALFAFGTAVFMFCLVLYNVAQVTYRQAACPRRLLSRMNAVIRWIVWGTMPLGALAGGGIAGTIGIRPTLWIGFVGSWAAGFWVYFSPLRRMRDIPSEPTELLALPRQSISLSNGKSVEKSIPVNGRLLV